MLLQIYGLVSSPTWWQLNRIPHNGGAGLSVVLQEVLPGGAQFEFHTEAGPLAALSLRRLTQLWDDGVGRLVAKPIGSAGRFGTASRLYLVTSAGSDAGRIFPLTRGKLSVGRGASRAQVRDPWLSGHHFDIRLASNGTLVAPIDQPQFLWESGEPFQAGSTSFLLHRGTGKPLNAPKTPSSFEIQPGQAPSPPNVVLQVIGAAAPLAIGIVLMVMTGMWYFLLFAGISVIIAAVMIMQYRRARKRFRAQIAAALDQTAETMAAEVFAPHQLTLALTSTDPDPLSLQTIQPEHPIIYVGTGIRKATMEEVSQPGSWDAHLETAVAVTLSLKPGQCTMVIGDPPSLRAVRNWCLAQLFRHAKATGTGIIIDGRHIGGKPTIQVSNLVSYRPDRHQLVFCGHATAVVDEHLTVIDLSAKRVDGAISAHSLEPLGISSAVLQRIHDEIALDQPAPLITGNYLQLSTATMQGWATDTLTTAVGVGRLGLTIDLVKDGPHLLIAGTTGSGKSELLLTVLIGMVERYPPTEASLILLDFKGGSSFNILEPLPHTMSVETNHVASTSFRSLDAIAAELHRREVLFADHSVPDYQEFRRSYPQIVLPRLVVAIDELRVLVNQNPTAAETLARLAATGRSLGFHLVIATQRTQGAVSSDIRANIGAIISLRTATEHDSWEVLGTADAFRISPSNPGRAYFKAGADLPQLFQTARYVLNSEPIVIQPHSQSNAQRIQATTDWTALVNQLHNRATMMPIPEPVILPELPQNISVAQLSTCEIPKRNAVLGLVDDPAQRDQYPVALGTTPQQTNGTFLAKSVAWIGAGGSGIELTANVVCEHVLSQPDRCVLLDGGHQAQNNSGWDKYIHSTSSDPDTLKQLLQWLEDSLTDKRPTTLIITDWGSWSTQLVTGSFQGLEDCLIQLLRQHEPILTIYVFGSRELAGGRMLAMIPDRFYLPLNSSPEHQMIWPKLIAVPPVVSRAVLVSAEQPAGGRAVQLCCH
ncbi:MAG TPA: hypothetical protein H9884_11715 [Candidatus Yaniella excrementigallinarum]|nr:hypothetical protein [Candidatus Yaniella excrementigallinarum]